MENDVGFDWNYAFTRFEALVVVPNTLEIVKSYNLLKIIGKDLTPYLLKEISLLSKGLTLKANTALILNNAKLAGKFAIKINEWI